MSPLAKSRFGRTIRPVTRRRAELPVQKFVHDLNLARFIEQLESETDPTRRTQLRALLIEEMDRSGSLGERMDQTDRLISRAAARLREQEACVAQLQTERDDALSSEVLLAHMSQILELMTQYRLALAQANRDPS
jgi:hypothetical protein